MIKHAIDTKTFFQHLINANSMPNTITGVRDTAGKKSDVVPALWRTNILVKKIV